jgi:transcription elongation GreA/GreB family factor
MSTSSQGPVRLSASARARLQEELKALRERRDGLVADSRALDTTGDRGDNAQPLVEDDEIARIDDRIDELSRVLAAGAGQQAGVPDGTTVTLRFGDGTEQTLQVVAITEEIPPGQEDTTITSDSPLGLALAGHQAGETISYATPAGAAQATILSLDLPG